LHPKGLVFYDASSRPAEAAAVTAKALPRMG
jgi:hypothetical protein